MDFSKFSLGDSICGHPLIKHVIDSNRFQRQYLWGRVSNSSSQPPYVLNFRGLYRSSELLSLLKRAMLSKFHLNRYAEYICLPEP